MRQYLHKSDMGKAWLPKILILVGLLFAECAVLLVPLDVANGGAAVGCGAWLGSLCGGLDLVVLWQVLFWAIVIWTLVVVPFGIFYYEAYHVNIDGSRTSSFSQCVSAFKWQIVTMVVFVPVFVIMYAFLAKSHVPVAAAEVGADSSVWMSVTDIAQDGRTSFPTAESVQESNMVKQWSKQSMEMSVSLSVFMIAFMSFIGWCFFIMYAGVGLIALPMDSIFAFIYRPKPIPMKDFTQQKNAIAKRAETLWDVGKLLKSDMRSNSKRKNRKNFNRFKQAILVLERDWEELNLCSESAYFKKPTCMNTLMPWFQLIFGVISILVSLLWLLHICVYLLPVAWGATPPGNFLNGFFGWFDTWFPLFGVIAISVFTFYLQLCVMKGNFKFGMRIFVLPLHPMIYGKTMANSFLFNIGLILMCTLPVVQFVVDAFQDYVRLTDISSILNVQVRNMDFFGVIFKNNIFVVALLGFALLCFLYFIACGKKSHNDRSDEKQLKKDIKQLNKKYKKMGLKKRPKKSEN